MTFEIVELPYFVIRLEIVSLYVYFIYMYLNKLTSTSKMF